MGSLTNYAVDQLIYPAAIAFLLVGSVFAVFIGLGLVTQSEAMKRFVTSMNRWISTREMMKSAESARDIDSTLHRQRYAWGIAIVAITGLSLVMLLRGYDVIAIAEMSRNMAAPVVVEVAAIAAKWLLVAGHLAGIALGIALVFFPRSLVAIEAWANRSYSFRTQGQSLDRMHLSIDRWVESRPRTAGMVILALALFVLVSLGGTFLSHS